MKIALFFLSQVPSETAIAVPGTDRFIRTHLVDSNANTESTAEKHDALMEALNLAVQLAEPGEVVMNVHYVNEKIA